jgi:hypothetical protein
MQLEAVSHMKNLLLSIIVIFFLTSSACSLALTGTISEGSNEPTKAPSIEDYTDEYVESLIQRYPYLSIGKYGTPSSEGALEKLNINLDALDLMGQRVGDCYNEFIYDLSPSYWLIIDRNACFGLRIWVELKSSSD